MENRKKMIMIASGKGGVGKTWFSITIAHALAQLKKRVLLFDGDLGLANVDIQLGLKPLKDLATVLACQSTFEDAIISYDAGFDIIAGRSGCERLSSLSSERLWNLMHGLTAAAYAYDHIIIDAGAGIGDSIKNMAKFVHTCWIVVTDEPTSLTDAYAFIKTIHGLYPHIKQQVVVNQAESIDKGQDVFQTLKRVCQNFLKLELELMGIIRRDSRVKDAIRHQVPLLSRYAKGNAALDIQHMAQNFK